MSELHDKIKVLLLNNGIDWTQHLNLASGIKELALEMNINFLKHQVFTPENMKNSCKCPVCNQNVKLYKKKIDSMMAFYLTKLYRISMKNPSKVFFHVEDDLKVVNKLGGSWAKLRYWNLIVQKPKDETDTIRRTSGMWRITDTGKMYAEGKLSLPKYIKLYNQTFYGFEGERVDIRSSLTDKFNYMELMSL
jgi:hypothetical protein